MELDKLKGKILGIIVIIQKKSAIPFLPCVQVTVDPLDLQASCHISNQNGQYFLSANIPYQKLHPWQLLAFYNDLVIWIKRKRFSMCINILFKMILRENWLS